LKILKQQIDAELPICEESLELIDIGRTFLVDREFRLINARKIALEASKQNSTSAGSPQSLSEDALKRYDNKRKSNPLMNIFRRPASSNISANVQGEENEEFFNNFHRNTFQK
jgi:hypothetical protein